MKKLLMILCIISLTGCAMPLREAAHTATIADAATTAIGLSTGIGTEINPLIDNPANAIVLFGLRIWLVERVNKMEEPRRTDWLSKINGLWWGVVISNTLILVSSNNPIGFMAGILGGWTIYKRANVTQTVP